MKMRSVVAGHWKLTTTREQSSKLILIATGEVAEEFSKDHSMIIWHWKQIGKMKKLDKWVAHELTANQKNQHFEVSSYPM